VALIAMDAGLPEAARASAQRIRIGSASWTDPSLVKSKKFYPKGCSSAEDRLRFYASRFNMVEVNSSYYALPSRDNSTLWVERTPATFVFVVKAFRLFTGHQTPIDALPAPIREALGEWPKKNIYYKDMPGELLDELWRLFKEAVQPLREAGKLSALHFQFAPWLVYSPAGRSHLEEVRLRVQDIVVSAEFRHRSWFDEKHRGSTLALERELAFAHVVVDEPQGFANSVPAVWEVTNPSLAVLRLHGRNAETWNIKGATVASDRFNYDYPDEELAAFVPGIRGLADQAEAVNVVFNNNYEDQGQRNASTLQRLLFQ
jgi:uncharacterized protein YecE (DUF72 family)